MSESEFAKWQSCQRSGDDLIFCDVCARTIWVAALKCAREHRGNFDIQFADWIDTEIKANGIETRRFLLRQKKLKENAKRIKK